MVASFDEPRRATPPVPPGLEGLGPGSGAPTPELGSSARSTPTIPPGFQAPTAVGSDKEQKQTPTKTTPLRKTPAVVTPAVPVLPATPLRAPTPLRTESRPEVPRIEKKTNVVEPATPVKGAGSSVKLAEPKADTKTPTQPTVPSAKATDVLPKADPAEASGTPSKDKAVTSARKADSKDKESITNSSPVASKTTAVVQGSEAGPSSKASKPDAVNAQGANESKQPVAAVDDDDQAGFQSVKRKHPGKLNIDVAVQRQAEAAATTAAATLGASSKDTTPIKAIKQTADPVSSRPGSPSIGSASTKKPAPRTLRVVSTPKAETPPTTTSTPPLPAIPSAFSKVPSRKPSVASIAPPGTPSSEHISDNISITSTSLSRANSPPPIGGKVGTAPVRAKTKNQAKKERQERAKALEEEKRVEEEKKRQQQQDQQQALDSTAPSASDATHEAIASRKKKSKKASATPKAAATPSAVTSGTATPVERQETVERAPPTVVEEPKVVEPVQPAVEVEAPEPERSVSPESDPELTPASLLADLRSTSNLIASTLDYFFRPLAQTNVYYKPSEGIIPSDLDTSHYLGRNPEVNITPEQLTSMLKGQTALRYGGNDDRLWSRGLVTPSGAHLRHLELDLEERYLLLEKELRSLAPEFRFHSAPNAKIPNGGIAAELPHFDLEAMKRGFTANGNGSGNGNGGALAGSKKQNKNSNNHVNRDANAMEKAVEEGSKKGSFLVDSSTKYINEFIMPPVPLSPSAAAATAAAKNGTLLQQQQQQKRQVSQESGGETGGAQAGAGAGAAGLRGGPVGGSALNLEELDWMLGQARKAADEKEGQLRKIIKKNRKAVGLTH